MGTTSISGIGDGTVKGAISTLNDNLTDKIGGAIKFQFGIDSDGNYGYIKDGADTVTPFKSGGGYGAYNIIAWHLNSTNKNTVTATFLKDYDKLTANNFCLIPYQISTGTLTSSSAVATFTGITYNASTGVVTIPQFYTSGGVSEGYVVRPYCIYCLAVFSYKSKTTIATSLDSSAVRTIDCTSISGYQNLTRDNFILTPATVKLSTSSHSTNSAYDFMSYNQSTGILTIPIFCLYQGVSTWGYYNWYTYNVDVIQS